MKVLHLPRMFLKDCVTTFKKKAESKPKEKAVAEKAKATDVLGPDAEEAAPEAAEVQENEESVEKASEE